MATNDKKSSFLDRLSGKVSEGFQPTNDVIHEGISDDELDKLLSADIKSSTRPPTNPSGPAEYADHDSSSDNANVFMDAITEDQPNTSEPVPELRVEDVNTADEAVSVITETSSDALNTAVDHVVVEKPTVETMNDSIDNADLVIDTSDVVDISSAELDAVDTPVLSTPSISIAGIGAKTTSFAKPSTDDTATPESTDSKTTDTTDTVSTSDATSESVDANATADVQPTVTETTADDVAVKIETTASSVSKDNSAKADNTAESKNSSSTSAVITPAPVISSNKSDTSETEQTKTAPNSATNTLTDKPSLTKGTNTMTDATQIEKIQSDIDELKRKVHSMSSEYFTAATDSAALIAQVREFDGNTSADFTGTYNQVRELRKILIDARKLFTQLPITLDMLEEALETDLYASKK